MRDEAIDPRGARRLIAFALMVFALWPAAAARAEPPTVTSVKLTVSGETVKWTLPEGMRSYSLEVAASPETYPDGDSKGSFLGENWAQAAIFLQSPLTTSWSVRTLPSGTYYVHVSAIDGTTCTSPLALGCPKEWSQTVEFSAPPRYFGIGLSLLGGRTPYMTWGSYCCPANFDIKLLEIATDPDVNADGPSEGLFLEENLVLSASAPSFNTADRNTVSYTSRPLAGGVYYMYAVGVDRTYCPTYDATRLLCRDEVSYAFRFTVEPTPPVLTFARHEEGAIDLEWTLPFGMRNDFVEVATAPDVYSSGPLRGAFRDENLVLFDDALFPQERSYTGADPLPPGTYYVHVAAYVSGSCSTNFPAGCSDDYSDTARITIPAPPAAPTVPAAASVDKATAFSKLRVRKVQSARRLSVLVVIAEDAVVHATGRVKVSGSSRTFKLRPVKRDIIAGSQVTLRLRLSRSALATVVRAIARHRRAEVRLTITARDRAGNETKERRTIRLRG